MEELTKSYDMFESIKHIDDEGCEYWLARELISVLGYNKWQNFEKIIYKAKITYENISGEKIACDAHNKIGKIVRNAIKEAGGTMSEEMPTPKKSLKELEKENIMKLNGDRLNN